MVRAAGEAQAVDDLHRLAAVKTPAERRDALTILAGIMGKDVTTTRDPLDLADRVEAGVRATVESLDFEPYRNAAEVLLLTASSGMNLTARRRMAAKRMGVSADTFRRRYEHEVLQEVALRLAGQSLSHTFPVGATGPNSDAPVGQAAQDLPFSSADVAVLRELLGEVGEAVLLVGSLLLVKVGGRAFGKTLSEDQLNDLRVRRPGLLADAHEALRFLLEADSYG